MANSLGQLKGSSCKQSVSAVLWTVVLHVDQLYQGAVQETMLLPRPLEGRLGKQLRE